ncbi:3-hydroxyisobutyryl-CoA hydrolase [Corynebacterium terpenotabidum]|nr:3-hydroxyisobutyryl-CoA hydrolase [Corynebacterium terpenotabidum]
MADISPTNTPDGAAAVPTVTAEVLGSGPGTTGVITLDRPAALNALDLDMIRRIGTALDTFASDLSVRQVLIRSALPKAYCAGGDVRVIRDHDLAGDSAAGDTYFREEYDVNEALATFPLPVVALLDGITMGGGLGMSMHATYRVITEKAWASMPEAAIGFVTDVGISHTFTHLPALSASGRPTTALGLWLATTAYRLTPGDLLWTGLATHLTTDAPGFTDRLLTEGLDAALAAEDASTAQPPESVLAGMAARIEELYAGGDWAEISARIAAATDQVGDLTRELLAPANPLSLEAMAQLLAYSAGHSLREALDAELTVGSWIRKTPNFAEGVRAVLVDKTRDAAFVPPEVSGISDADRRGIRSALEEARQLSATRRPSR